MVSRPRQFNVILEPVLASPAMRRIDRVLRTVADKDVTVTLIGPSGTGKEVLARRLHELSSRRAEPFIPINCAAIPESLFESELFGHERGAFTGASQLARGKVEAANGGTLFLDEIGEMPVQMQAKLLRFLENHRFMRVGGTAKLEVDVRLVCATLRPLEEEVRAGRFRGDLYYRIQGITLEVPPLCERRADILDLARQFVAEISAKHRIPAPRLARSVKAALRSYDWPGNVRELKNSIELVCLLRSGRSVRIDDLPERIRASVGAQPPPQAGRDTLEVRLDRPLAEIVDDIIDAALELEGGNRSRAAARLGIGLRTVQRRMSAGAGKASG